MVRLDGKRDDRLTGLTHIGASYFVNEITFLNEDGYLVNLIFDGKAYICNDEGKTVHRIHRAGFVSNEPLSEAA